MRAAARGCQTLPDMLLAALIEADRGLT
jgi:hypothetical protein